MSDKNIYVYILKNDYMPDAGTWIEGVYSTPKKAEERLKLLKSGESEYGFNEEDTDNFEIDIHQVY
jgi:hypothetical protein